MNILVFSPYSGIWVHSMPEMVVARELVKAGHVVHIMRCDGTLDKYCPVMTAYGRVFDSSDKDKARICDTCINSRLVLDDELYTTTSVLTDHLALDDVLKIDTLLTSITPQNFESLQIDGLPIGKYATYELLLNHKISNLAEIEKIWDEYLENLRQCLIAHRSVSNFLRKNRIDRLVVYNSLYSLNRTAVKYAEKINVKWSTIHGGKNVEDMLRTLTVNSSDAHDLLITRSNEWRKWENTPLSPAEITSVRKNLEYVLGAKSAFTYSSSKKKSKPSGLRKYFDIDNDNKVLLCILSSADERFAGDQVETLEFKMTDTDSSVFRNTNEWILFLVDFIERHTDFHLIIRVHPREFPNHRDSIQSKRGSQLLELSKQHHARVSWNLPSDRLSLYDLAEITHVVLNGTSTSGVELMAFGLPVVIYDAGKLFAYPPNHNYVGETFEDYERSILEASKIGWSLTNSIRAFRFRSFLFNVLAVPLHDAVPSRTNWSAERITDGLRNRKNFPIPIEIHNWLRRREISRIPNKVLESEKIVRAIIENVDTVAQLHEPPPDRSESIEKSEIRRALAKLTKRFFDTEDVAALGSRIMRDDSAHS